VDSEVVEKEIEARARDYARKAKIPGFRPGKIPPEVIKKRFRAQVLEEAAEAIINRVVFEELEGRGLRPLASPQVKDVKIEERQPLTFRAIFETLPIVEMPEYRGLKVKSRKPSVSEADVDKEIDSMRDAAAQFSPVEDRASHEGDFVVLDLSWIPFPDGPGGHDENAMVQVGSRDSHADLNAALVGLKPGERKTVRIEYPKDHASTSLAGRTVEYSLTLKAIKQKVLPAADDEFAKDLGEFDTFDALRESVRRGLQAAEERKVDRETKNLLLEAVVAEALFEVPEALVERHMNARTEGAARSLALQGVDPRKTGINWKDYREAQREDAVKAAKADILLDEIARREGIEALPAETDQEIARLAARLKKSKETLRLQMEKDGDLQALRGRIREEKTLDLLKANARLEFE